MDFTLDFSIHKKEYFSDHVLNDIKQTADDAQAETQSKTEYDYSVKINEKINNEAHTYSQDASYRRLLVDTDDLFLLIEQMNADPELAGGYGVFMKVFVPAIDENIGFYTKNLQNILIYDSTGGDPNLPTFFFPNTTTLIELQVDRINSNVSVSTTPKIQ